MRALEVSLPHAPIVEESTAQNREHSENTSPWQASRKRESYRNGDSLFFVNFLGTSKNASWGWEEMEDAQNLVGED